MNSKLSVVIAFSLMASFVTSTFAQSGNSGSPYSLLGLGELQTQGFASNRAMGGISLAVQELGTSQLGNPASFASNSLTTFHFGLNATQFVLKTSDQQQLKNNVNLAYFALSLPVKSWWGMGFGLLPYSNVDYSISSSSIDVNNVLRSELYSGVGGINRIYFSNGFKTFKGLQLGIDASYMFGELNQQQFAEFSSGGLQSGFYNLYISDATRVSDVLFKAGAQYKINLNKDQNTYLTLGATADLSQSLSAKNSKLAYRYLNSSSGNVIVRDSISGFNPLSINGNINLPVNVGFGVALGKPNRYLISLEAQQQNWSQYSSIGFNDTLVDATNFIVGGYFVPSKEINPKRNYFGSVKYRYGAYYNTGFLNLKGEILPEYGVSFGGSFPLESSFFVSASQKMNWVSSLDVAFEYAKKGSTNNGLILEDVYKITVGLTLNDRWFIKRKYD